jgi:hypothetical protein
MLIKHCTIAYHVWSGNEFQNLRAHTWNALSPQFRVFDSETTSKFSVVSSNEVNVLRYCT